MLSRTTNTIPLVIPNFIRISVQAKHRFAAVKKFTGKVSRRTASMRFSEELSGATKLFRTDDAKSAHFIYGTTFLAGRTG